MNSIGFLQNDLKPYDGSSPLRPAIIELFGYGPKSKTSATKKIQQAKSDLKITDKGKNLPANVNLAIWEHLRNRLNSDEDKKGRMVNAKPAKPVSVSINLGGELAALFGFSPKSANIIVKLNQEAKEALGITSAQITNSEKAAILQYHSDKVRSTESTGITARPPKKPVKPVEVLIALHTDEASSGEQAPPVDDLAKIERPVEALSAPSQDEAISKLDLVQQHDIAPTPKPDIEIDPEFKGLIPPLSSDEYALLEANIIERGCRDALVLWGSILIDGHNRFEICQKHRISFEVRQEEFASRDDVLLWIIENQLGRRNLTKFARGELVLKGKPLIAARAKTRQQGGQGGVLLLPNSVEANTQKELAKAADVGHDSIHKIENIITHGTPELIAAVRSGEVSINAGHVAAQLPPDEQNEVVAQVEAGEKTTKAIKKQIPEATEKKRDVYAAIKKITSHLEPFQSKQGLMSLVDAIDKNSSIAAEIEKIRTFLDDLEAALIAAEGAL